MHATEKAFAGRSLLHDENENLLQQNDERGVRQNAKSTVIDQGNAKIVSYADVVEMQRSREAKADAKKAKADAAKAKVPAKRKRKVGPIISIYEPDVQACQMVEGLLPPCPGRAPVARMWSMSHATLGGVVT